MPCPNCGFISAPGTMFCGKCGTRLSSAPAQPNPYQPPAPPAGGYVPPQRPAYTPPAAPAQHVQPPASAYVSQAPAAPSTNTYQSYGASMMQSPYITSAARSAAPVISSSRDSAAQYTAVSTNVYSPQARAAAQASEVAARKKKSGGIVMTVIALVILAATAAMVYFSGLLEQNDNSIYVPEASGSVQQSTTKPSQNTPAVSGSDVSGSEVVIVPDDSQAETSTGLPAGLSANDYASLNGFVSAFTEVGLVNINGSLSTKDLMSFAVASLSINSNVYASTDFEYGSESYSYSISEDFVSQHISRYFGENVQIFPAVGDSGDGWIYYGDSYYFSEVAQSQGFAIITDYESDGELVNISFNVYASGGNDADYYGMTAKEAEEAGCTVIGSGTATLGKLYRNNRDTYLMQSIETAMN